VKASKVLCVPSQTKRHWRRSTSGLKVVGVALADAAVQAVAGDDQVGVRGYRLVVGGVGLEDQFHAERSQRSCRMFSRRLRPMPQKPWPPERTWRPLDVDLDVVPVVEGVARI
jgi:hypothetical protein